jgi:hypothetical protein
LEVIFRSQNGALLKPGDNISFQNRKGRVIEGRIFTFIRNEGDDTIYALVNYFDNKYKKGYDRVPFKPEQLTRSLDL